LHNYVQLVAARGRVTHAFVAVTATVLGIALLQPVHAQTVLEQCADRSPTHAALTACLDAVLIEAERDLANKVQLARESLESIPGREQRARNQRAFDRAQRRFFYERDSQCGGSRESLPQSDRGNQMRACMIQFTRSRTEQIAGTLPLQSMRSQERAQPKPASDPVDAVARPSSDPVYGVDWRLTRIIRDNKELPLPPKYKANLRLETDGRMSGYGAASAFTGRYRLRSPGKIEWSENGFLITHDAQQPDPTQTDYLYIDSLERTTRAGLSKSGLVLRNEDNSISLSFER
jgi:uncharacterized protein YecT (DUF1311 family)